jgi:hypothetical protein
MVTIFLKKEGRACDPALSPVQGLLFATENKVTFFLQFSIPSGDEDNIDRY